MKFDEQPPVELDPPQGLHSAGQRLIYRNITPIFSTAREQHNKLAQISVPLRYLCVLEISVMIALNHIYEGWNFNFGNTPLDWIQELLE